MLIAFMLIGVNAEGIYAECKSKLYLLSDVKLTVTMLCVIMMNVAAPPAGLAANQR
jgi:hypothetical protein